MLFFDYLCFANNEPEVFKTLVEYGIPDLLWHRLTPDSLADILWLDGEFAESAAMGGGARPRPGCFCGCCLLIYFIVTESQLFDWPVWPELQIPDDLLLKMGKMWGCEADSSTVQNPHWREDVCRC